ncbi:MAG: MerR family transcriptional regulator [Anaerolineales bacterium]|nr:MerR family transcriptional regulator [Anaerolineales bacterium]
MLEISPTFNLKAVVLETGIKPHTLRAWEQRYGLPRPQRSEGNHRTYSQKDIEVVKWLLLRQEEGMTISRAVELWHHMEGQTEDPLQINAYPASAPMFTVTASDALATIRQKWLDGCMKFDKATVDHVLTQAFAIYPVQMVCLEILQKGIAQIGDLWFRNAATVQQEHFVSALIIERLNALLAAAPPPTRLGRLLVFCPPYEDHTIPLLLLSLLLRYRGWEVVYLGASVPLSQLESTLEIIKPQLVISTAQRIQSAASLSTITQFLQEKGINCAFGGSIFNINPALHSQISGHFLGKSIEDAVHVVGQIMAFDPPASKIKPISDNYEQAALVYRAKRRLIEFDAMHLLENETIPHEYLDKTNFRLAQDILAALSLGDLNFLNPELKLSNELMVNYNISLDWQARYFEAYLQSAQKNLNRDGLPIIEWLDKIRIEIKSSNGSLNGSYKVNSTALMPMKSQKYHSQKPDKGENGSSGKMSNQEWSLPGW